MVLVASLGSALCYAVASVLQRHVAAGESGELSLRPRLLLRLFGRPLWLAGIAADLAGYALEFFALAHGSLVLVKPLLVSGLLFALPLDAVVDRRPLRRADWVGAVCIVAGLATFLVAADPGRGSPSTSGLAWLVLGVVTLGPAAVLVLTSGPPGPRRAFFLAAATGLLYGLTAALTKATGHLLDAGAVHTFTRWEPYALLAVGFLSLLIGQSAFQAGPLSASLPTLAVVDPLASIAIGAVAFGEGLASHGVAPLLEMVGLVGLVVGIGNVARFQLLHGEPEATPS